MTFEIKVNENNTLTTDSIEKIEAFIIMIDDIETVTEWHLTYGDNLKLDCKDRINAIQVFSTCMETYFGK